MRTVNGNELSTAKMVEFVEAVRRVQDITIDIARAVGSSSDSWFEKYRGKAVVTDIGMLLIPDTLDHSDRMLGLEIVEVIE
jgi:hypothetical protein